MKTKNMLGRFLILTFIALLLMPQNAYSQKKSKKKKEAATEVASLKKPEGKTISELVKKSKNAFIIYYQDNTLMLPMLFQDM